jgi:hypothetical protein
MAGAGFQGKSEASDTKSKEAKTVILLLCSSAASLFRVPKTHRLFI